MLLPTIGCSGADALNTLAAHPTSHKSTLSFNQTTALQRLSDCYHRVGPPSATLVPREAFLELAGTGTGYVQHHSTGSTTTFRRGAVRLPEVYLASVKLASIQPSHWSAVLEDGSEILHSTKIANRRIFGDGGVPCSDPP